MREGTVTGPSNSVWAVRIGEWFATTVIGTFGVIAGSIGATIIVSAGPAFVYI